jgi:hypothetical protein
MSDTWSYIQNGNTLGPVSEETLRNLLREGLLGWEDLVWHPGLSDWTKAGKFPELTPGRIALDEPPRMAAPPAPRPIVVRGEDPFAKVAMAGALDALRATKPWVRFLGVLGIIGIVFMALGGLVFLGLSQSSLLPMPSGMRTVLPVAYLLMAGLQVPPVVYLNRYASRIARALISASPEDLTDALEAQKSFWRYMGILTLVMMIMYVVVIVLGIAGAVAMGGRHRF